MDQISRPGGRIPPARPQPSEVFTPSLQMPDTPTVLVVEDDVETLQMMHHFLRLEGYQVLSARNGQEALQVLRKDARPGVILLDLMMPIMDGWQFRAAQRADPALADIPVVIVSAVGTPQQMTSLEAAASIQKPIDFDRLLAMIRQYCG